MIQPDHWIRRMAYDHRMIDPYSERSEHGISFGLSSFGYDLRCADRWRIYAQPTMFGEGAPVINPKRFDPAHLCDVDAPYCDIPANSVALTSSVEYFRIPQDVLCIVLGKSTYARCGLIVNVTPLEPGWKGHITMELSNTAPLPIRVYAYEGIAQVLFIQGASPCEVSYADKQGQYQCQGRDVVLPRVK